MIQSNEQMQRIVDHFRNSDQELETNEWIEAIRLYKLNAKYNISTYKGQVEDQEQFISRYEQNWKVFFRNLATWQNIIEPVIGLESYNNVLFLAWLCPELPKTFKWALSKNILFLVTDIPSWLIPLENAGCTLNIRKPGFLRELTSQMSQGRSIGVMLDNAYSSTSSISVKFFGRIVKTPVGIFDLAIQNNYSINFLAPCNGKIAFIEKKGIINQTSESLAIWYNELLESEMKIQPAKWLNWWSVHFRENIVNSKYNV